MKTGSLFNDSGERSFPIIYLSRLLIVLGFALAAAAGFKGWGDPASQERISPDPLAEGKRPDRPDEAFKFRLLQTQDERKQIPADGLLKAKAQLEGMRAAQAERAARAGKPEGEEVARLIPSDWKWLGPGNVGGRIRAIVIHPTSPNKMWVGSASGGIWHSTNGGDS